MDAQTILLATGIGSGWLIVGYGVRMIFKGDLVTGPQHRDALAERDKQNEALRETNRHLVEQNSVMLGSAIPTVNRVLTALGQAVEER